MLAKLTTEIRFSNSWVRIGEQKRQLNLELKPNSCLKEHWFKEKSNSYFLKKQKFKWFFFFATNYFLENIQIFNQFNKILDITINCKFQLSNKILQKIDTNVDSNTFSGNLE